MLRPAGAVIFAAGEPGECMYVLRSGEARIEAGGAEVDRVGAGDILGEMALLDHGPRSATAVAETDCELAPIDARRFVFLVQETPYFALEVMKVLADRLRRMNTARPARRQ